jgi:RecA-family ATPase
MTNKQRQKLEDHDLLMQFIEEDCYVDSHEKIDYPPVAISYGEKLLKNKKGDDLIAIPIGTFGNLSVVTAPPKTKKTFFISLLSSVFLSGRNVYGGKIKGHRGNGHLVHFDTEQGLWHCQKVFKRVYDMDSTINKDIYHTFGLRAISHKTRLEFIEYYLSKKINTPSLVIIDGIADLVSDVNSLEESNAVVQKLMEWSANYNCHIINVIHQNFGSSKLGTGHLGSFLEKKAETVISLEANTVNKDWVTVKCGRSRGYSFETFSFQVNDLGIPCIVDDLYDPLN